MVGAADLNLRPSGPKPDALPDCATPRSIDLILYIYVNITKFLIPIISISCYF